MLSMPPSFQNMLISVNIFCSFHSLQASKNVLIEWLDECLNRVLKFVGHLSYSPLHQLDVFWCRGRSWCLRFTAELLSRNNLTQDLIKNASCHCVKIVCFKEGLNHELTMFTWPLLHGDWQSACVRCMSAVLPPPSCAACTQTTYENWNLFWVTLYKRIKASFFGTC